MKKSRSMIAMALVVCLVMGTLAVGCAIADSEKADAAQPALTAVTAGTVSAETSLNAGTLNAGPFSAGTTLSAGSSTATVTAGTAIFEKADLFSDRDLKQEADLSKAVTYTVSDGEDVTITAAGVYVLTGSAKNVTVYVEADKEDKVQLVLDGLTLSNSSAPAIYVKSADKVFVTTSHDSSLSVTGTFAADGGTNLDGVIFSKSDITFNGTATLTISSTKNGVVGKDDLKITGGDYVITAQAKAIEANDSIRIADGTLQLTAGTDALHAKNDDDDSKGYIYIGGGDLTIRAGDDGVHAVTVVQVDDGALAITASEGIEGTYIQLNGGTITIQASDDGINAARKSSAYRPTVEINGGDITVSMGSGDTDGVDSNGDIIVNGGTISVTGSSTFDYDGTGQINGGTVIVNGQQVTTLPNQFGGGPGGFGGNSGGPGGWGGNGGFGGRGGRGGW